MQHGLCHNYSALLLNKQIGMSTPHVTKTLFIKLGSRLDLALGPKFSHLYLFTHYIYYLYLLSIFIYTL